MRIVIFCHSLASDWNHGNAHFLRGICAELVARGHHVHVYEPHDAWSAQNLAAEAGEQALDDYRAVYPQLRSLRYDPHRLDLEGALDQADVVLVHEWNAHELVRRIGVIRARSRTFTLLFHDTHHRSVSDPRAMAAYDLRHYDGVLAFGEVIRERYQAMGWARRAWTWHEAADPRVFRPLASQSTGDLVWIGNWGDDERSEELRRYLIAPSAKLRLKARVHGVRYPTKARAELTAAGIDYAGWLPNYRVPGVFAQFRVTVHVPRRPYVEALPGIPTIRVFEALACGIPLVSCWWDDRERLFTPGKDFLMVRTPAEMTRALRDLLFDPDLAAALAEHGRRTVLRRHTCGHRVDELFAIVREIRRGAPVPASDVVSL